MSSQTLHLAGAEALEDLGTFAGRLRAANPDAAVRLVARGSVLAAWGGVLEGHGLTGAGAVLGLRVLPLADRAAPTVVDVTVAAGAVCDRVARAAATADRSGVLAVPPGSVFASWAGMLPPQQGWASEGPVAVLALRQAATAGIAEIAQGAPVGAGAAAVAELRTRVWSRPVAVTGTGSLLTCGMAFAAHVLGFLPAAGSGPDARPTVHTAGRWVRLSSATGHVLARRAG